MAKYIKGKISVEKCIIGGKTMKRVAGRLLVLSVLVVILSTFMGCQGVAGPTEPSKKTILFNGKDLAGWKLFIPDEAIDVNKIWSVRNGVVHCEGKPNGYMRTKNKYENYHLHLEWRWAGEPTNSGVLLHASGQDKVWPRCIECQLKAGSAGDFVLINGTGITVDGRDRQDVNRQFVGVPRNSRATKNRQDE